MISARDAREAVRGREDAVEHLVDAAPAPPADALGLLRVAGLPRRVEARKGAA